MSKQLIISFITFLTLGCLSAFADNGSGNGNTGNGDGSENDPPIVLGPTDPNKPRPRDAYGNENTVFCYLNPPFIELVFDEPEDSATVQITNLHTSTIATAAFDSLLPYNLYIGSDAGIYHIIIKTHCNQYEGYFAIE